MRLLDLTTGDFVEYSTSSEAPPYAILSHRWDEVEQTYQDIKEIQILCEKNRRPSTAPPLRTRRFKLLSRARSSLSHNRASPLLPPPALPRSIWDPNSGISDKVRRACEVARADGCRYLWIDSCCINKASSSELSESINSMFAWYRDANVCYTFLVDVPTTSVALLKAKDSAFRSSVWFTRGWTLQELIAPGRLVFLSQTWEPLGTKASLSKLIEEITGIPISVLANSSHRLAQHSLDRCSVAQRMSWAANRNTTKVEDEAYCLLGIFDIEMPLLYGEGRRAFRRLQEEILRRIPDQSIFAWGNVHPASFSTRTADQPMNSNSTSPGRNIFRSRPDDTAATKEFEARPRRPNFFTGESCSMFAESPAAFAGAGRVVTVHLDAFRDLLAAFCQTSPQEYTPTPHGIRTNIPLLPLSSSGCPIPVEDGKNASADWYLAVLACQQSDCPLGQLLCCVCKLPGPMALVSTLHRGYLTEGSRRHPTLLDTVSCAVFRVSLSPPSNDGQLGASRLRPSLRPHTVYLDHPARAPPSLDFVPGHHRPEAENQLVALTFTLPTWSRGALRTRGYDASLKGPASEVGGGRPGVHRLTVSPLLPPRTPWSQSRSHSQTRDPDPMRWTVVVDFSYQHGGRAGESVIRAAVYVASWDEFDTGSLKRRSEARAPGPMPTTITDVIKPTTLEWSSVGASGQMVERLRLERAGHERVTLVLGVQCALGSRFLIDVEFVDWAPSHSGDSEKPPLSIDSES